LIVNIYQRTPFFDAVEAGDLTRVKELLASDPALVRSETFMGYTGLHLAVRSNNSNMVQFLIKAGANVNAEGDGETPLLLAAFYGRPQIAEILLKAGADVNAPGFKDLDPPLTDFCITD
jgi:ankyrin repeat protein